MIRKLTLITAALFFSVLAYAGNDCVKPEKTCPNASCAEKCECPNKADCGKCCKKDDACPKACCTEKAVCADKAKDCCKVKSDECKKACDEGKKCEKADAAAKE